MPFISCGRRGTSRKETARTTRPARVQILSRPERRPSVRGDVADHSRPERRASIEFKNRQPLSLVDRKSKKADRASTDPLLRRLDEATRSIVQSRNWMAKNSSWMRKAQDRMSHLRELEEQRRREQSPKEPQLIEKAGEYVLEYPRMETRVHDSEFQPPVLPSDLREETPFGGETLPGYQPEPAIVPDVTVQSPLGRQQARSDLQMARTADVTFSPATTPGRHDLTEESIQEWFNPETDTEFELNLEETFGMQIEGETEGEEDPGSVAGSTSGIRRGPTLTLQNSIMQMFAEHSCGFEEGVTAGLAFSGEGLDLGSLRFDEVSPRISDDAFVDTLVY